MSATWMRAHEFGQPLMLIGDRHVELGVDVLEPLLQLGHQHLRRACGSRRTTACRTRCRCRPSGCGASATASTAAPARPGRRRSSSSLSSGTSRTISFWYGVKPDPVRARRLGEVGDLGQDRAGHPARDRRDADGVQSVLQLLHADVVDRVLDRLRRGAVDQLAAQVLVLEHLAEFLDAPVLDQELQPRLGRAAAGSRSRGTPTPRPPRRRAPRPAAPRRRPAGPASGWSTGRRRPTGRGRGRARGG